MPHETIFVIDVVVPPPQVVAVDVYVGGRTGPPGPKGDKGDKGDPGVSIGAAQGYMFNTSTVAPPGNSSVRLDNANQTLATLLWLHYNNEDGIDIRTYLQQRLTTGDTLYMQDRDDASKWQLYEVSSAFSDGGTYATIPVIWKAGGAALTGQRIIITRES